MIIKGYGTVTLANWDERIKKGRRFNTHEFHSKTDDRIVVVQKSNNYKSGWNVWLTNVYDLPQGHGKLITEERTKDEALYEAKKLMER